MGAVPILAHEDDEHRHHRAAERVEVLVGHLVRLRVRVRVSVRVTVRVRVRVRVRVTG